MGELLQGKGAQLGPFVTRFPLEQRTMLHVLDLQARDQPDATWLVFDGADRLSFGKAQVLAHRFGNALIEELGGACHVGLYMRNQVEFFPTFYGALAAGGVAVPLNADARGLLLERVIVKSDVRVLVARTDLLANLEALDSLGQVELVLAAGPADELPESVAGVRVAPLATWLEGRSAERPAELPDSSDTALIQFTSGTTGSAKGVVYPHHFLFLYSANIADAQGHTSDDVLSSPLPAYHVAALHIIANAALHAGCLAHLKSRFAARSYWTEIADDEATWTILLGPIAAILLKTSESAPSHRLKAMFCVPFPPDGEEFERRFDVKLLWQGYGMTEVYPHPMPSVLEEGLPKDTIGHPASWFDYGVVDEHDRMLPVGEVGELVYRSRLPDAMAREYYKDPEATLRAFRNFMFHTGDLGYRDEQGRLHYAGRRQDRIRRRGENVSAAELEFIALGHPDVLEAAAFGVPGELGEHEIKLDVVVAEGRELDLSGYHAWLDERLPRYMVPRYLELRPSFPKTPSERIEKYKLMKEGVERPEVCEFAPARRQPA